MHLITCLAYSSSLPAFCAFLVTSLACRDSASSSSSNSSEQSNKKVRDEDDRPGEEEVEVLVAAANNLTDSESTLCLLVQASLCLKWNASLLGDSSRGKMGRGGGEGGRLQ